MNLSLRALACVLPCLAASTAAAQQFQEQLGRLPLPTNYWTEGTTIVDANEDGRWDCLFVHANGWAVPGDFAATGPFGLPLLLLVNLGTSSGNPAFADQSSQYLPSLALHAKGAAVADLDNDGHDDIAVAVAFQGRQRVLIKNASTLAWSDESATRLPNLVLNCHGAGLGDVDDDGDIDLVFSDAGPASFAAPGGRARLCVNDGHGFFSEPAGWLVASNKIGAQNAKLVDIDNDFDLDVIIDGKSPQTQLYLNDGQGRFSEDDTTIPAAVNVGDATYETDWADLDNDDDVDGVIMSLDFYSEGAARNALTETGTLSFSASTSAMTGLPPGEFEDDNEFAFVDADDDGDLDVITASLQHPDDKLYRNAGAFGPGFLHYTQGAGFSAPAVFKDATLDMCVADFDGDGDYDAISGQGESGDFTDRYYRNEGPPDTLPPRIGRVQFTPATVPVAALAAGGIARRAWIQDATWDDGWTFTTASLLIETEKLGEVRSSSAAMRHGGGQIFRGVLAPAPATTGLVGMQVTYRVEARDPNGNTSVSSAYGFLICGSESYGTPSLVNSIALAGNTPAVGGTLSVSASGGAPDQPGMLIVGTSRASAPLFGGQLLVSPHNALLFPIAFDGSGTASFSTPLPSNPTATGIVLDLQCAELDASKPLGIALSTGVEMALCAP